MGKSPAAADVVRAAAALERGEVVALPTETYYALAVDALSERALGALFACKGRGASHAVSLLVEPEMLPMVVAEIPSAAMLLMAAHWPGPLTLALPARPGLPERIVQDGCVAVRICGAKQSRAVVRAFGRPVTATSANPTGAPPCRTPAEVQRAFPGLLVVGNRPTPGGLPSTLVRVAQGRVTVLRQGPIEIERF